MLSKRVVLDTNIWISFLISKRQRQLDSLIRSGEIKLIFSKELLEEFIEVTSRPKLRKYFTDSELNAPSHR